MIPIPRELVEQFESGDVLLFIGERILRDAEGRAIVDILAEQLAVRSGTTDEGTLTLPETAQAYEDEKGRQALVQFLRDQLDRQGDAPEQAHRLIAGLTDCRLLATTCLDRRLERAFAQAGRPLDVIIGNADAAFENKRNAQLYKLHGSLDQSESLVLTEDDYETFFEDQASISVVLQGYLARKTIVFVGYDLADSHFKRLYRKMTAPLDNYARRAYAVSEPPPPKARRWCERQGMEVIEADDTAFLESLVQHLATRARPIPIAPPQPVEDFAVPLPKHPYKLLDYYETQDTAIFFGRRDETQRLTSLIHAHRLVLLYGAPGTGKTSLLLAGVVPQLERTDSPYTTIYVQALEDPACAIRRAVKRKLPDTELPTDGGLVDLVAAATTVPDRTLVIILDQFEEFFIRLSPASRQAFIAELGALYDARDVPVKVVLGLREDWLASVNEIRQRIPGVFNVDMRLLPLTQGQAHRAITAPVEQLSASYEPALVEQLLNDLAESESTVIMPPRLQLVCSALYDDLGSHGNTITLSAYKRMGGTHDMLLKYLDDKLAQLVRNEQALARDALEELVTSERTKAVKTGDELALALGVALPKLEPVLEKLVRSRLLRPVERATDSGPGAVHAYELAHEYLIVEIALSPEAVARKEAEELLRQGIDDWQRFDSLLSVGTFVRINAQRDRLRLDAKAQELMLRSGLHHGISVAYWLARADDGEKALALTQETLLMPQAEPARQNLSIPVDDVDPQRLHILVAWLAVSWWQARGTIDFARASDALWALRPYLPRPLRIQLAVSRSPRLVRRTALPLACGVLAIVVFIFLKQWGLRLWAPKPDIEWVDVPGGDFMMGNDEGSSDEQPVHIVVLDDFRISKYEITNAEYAQCVRATVCGEPENVTYYSEKSYADYPVGYVSWSDAQTFCQWVGGRLLTEAEWEYAARGEDGHIYPWGNEAPTCERAQYGGCEESTVPVGSRSAGASWCGGEDMAGNVWEWVADWYGPYPSEAQVNPTGPEAGTAKVLRGGSFTGDEMDIRATTRHYSIQGDRIYLFARQDLSYPVPRKTDTYVQDGYLTISFEQNSPTNSDYDYSNITPGTRDTYFGFRCGDDSPGR